MEFIPKATKESVKESLIYRRKSIYQEPNLVQSFLQLKANVCDLSLALVKKCITGSEQDFIMLMEKAKDFILEHFPEQEEMLLLMFRQCVFGYYVLTPFIEDEEVSDIKIYSYDHITIKANGKRYVTDAAFYSRVDYEQWLDRMLLIQKMGRWKEEGLMHMSDRKGADAFYLRIDCETGMVTSTGQENIHIRKLPKEKYSWEHLTDKNMLEHQMADYIRDRILAGYGFLISGRGGSGKTTLLNVILDEIPYDESVLVVQESDELYSHLHPQIQFEHTVDPTEKSGGYTLEDELRMGLLQDIDNFVIGEIKGGEALYVFTTALSTGARFFGTIHANDAAASVKRLAHCARYISDYPVETLEEMISGIPFVLIHLSSFSIDEILEIDGYDTEIKRLKFQTIYQGHGGLKASRLGSQGAGGACPAWTKPADEIGVSEAD
ncbi:MAG: Flp pilus assembly complex ATPase component TadA [Lachnospiraceae bacterium]|nr:Flp pilus assembly complex ATPase component TadA [Lachnospiraceae bacterium]